MGCFCIEAVQALHETEEAETEPVTPEAPVEDETVAAVGTWLAARWLPAAEWAPDPEWQQAELPDPPMAPESLGVLVALVQAYQAGQTMQLDLTVPDQVPKLARIIGTLNRRMPALEWMERDTRPWNQVAALNDQTDSVRGAIAQGVFAEQAKPEPEPPLAPWRPLIIKVKALAPLLAVGQMLDLDLADDAAPEQLAKLVRSLRKVVLPPLENPLRVFRVIARLNAIARIEASFGADPRTVPFQRIRAALDRKIQAVKEMLPEQIEVKDGRLLGMPFVQPNPSQLVNADTIAAARGIRPETMERLRWKPPPAEDMDLLTTGAPVMTLTRLMRTLRAPPVRAAPCQACDAATVMRGLATASPDSGTGAAPAA